MRSAFEALVRAIHWPNTVLLLGLVSAVFVESDLYRYCLPFLLLQGIVAYYLREDRPSIGPMGFLCALWGLHVGLRLALGMLDHGDPFRGSAEGIYLLALVLPTLGYAFYLHRSEFRMLTGVFVVASLAALLLSLDPAAIFAGERAPFLFHANTIHASIGGGLIVLAMSALLLHLLDAPDEPRRLRAAIAVLAAATIALALLGILGARSKGVWLALGLSLPAMLVTFLAVAGGGRRLVPVLIGSSACALLFGFFFADQIAHELLPNVDAALAIGSQVASQGDLIGAFEDAMAAGYVPSTFDQRLALWVNALEVWRQSIVLGSGTEWIDLWAAAPYSHRYANLIHNGYLEIAVRYGIVGLAFYAFGAGWTLWQAAAARREGIIGNAVFALAVGAILFFALTLVTNSNVRLAIGESFMLVSGGFGFFCYFLRKDAERAASANGRPR